jgi:hypothetical protein
VGSVVLNFRVGYRSADTEFDAWVLRLGSVEEFMLERLEPKRGRELSGGDIFAAYRSWCGKRSDVPYSQQEFGRQFRELAALSSIAFSGSGTHGVYVDVSLSGW